MPGTKRLLKRLTRKVAASLISGTKDAKYN